MTNITKEQAVELAREAGAATSDGVIWNFDNLDPIKLIKLGRNAGLEEAKRKCCTVKTAHATEWKSFPADPNMVKVACIAAIESLKDNTL